MRRMLPGNGYVALRQPRMRMQLMRRRRVPFKRGDEYDALTRWRHYLLWRPGERKAIKRRVSKRERRTKGQDIVENGP